MLLRLRQELKQVMPDPAVIPSLPTLEKLEYLSAIVAEGHRITTGVLHRLPRISPHHPIVYGDWEIPAGWPVGMSSIYMHFNEDIFPSPQEFDPDRFLGEGGQKRKKYLVPFGKGTRR